MKLINIANYLGIVPPQSQQAIQPVKDPNFDPEKLGPKEVYYTWQTQGRPEKKGASQKLIRTFLVIGIVIALLLAIMGEFFLILVIGSIVFISYVLANTPPEDVTYEISSHGVMINEVIYYWHQLKDFYFSNATGMEMIAINTVEKLPGRIYLTCNPVDKDKIYNILAPKLNFLKTEPTTFMDKAYSSFIDKFKFE